MMSFNLAWVATRSVCIAASLVVSASAQEYDPTTHNLQTMAERIEVLNYYLQDNGFRITEIEDCVLYDHQAGFSTNSNGYDIQLSQLIIDLRKVEAIQQDDKGRLRLRMVTSSSTLVSSASLSGENAKDAIGGFRIEALNRTLWDDFLKNESEQLLYLYREATYDQSIVVVSLQWASETEVLWDFSKFQSMRPQTPIDALLTYHAACNES